MTNGLTMLVVKSLSRLKNRIFAVLGHNGWEGHCPGPKYKIQNIVVIRVGEII